MADLQIFTDSRWDEGAMKLLREGTAPHRLLFPAQMLDSVLVSAATDPIFAEADIAFGQPDAASVMKSDRLRWLHLTTAGYTRYDTPEFRAHAARRGLLVSNSSRVYAEACAQHVLAFMLAESRHLPEALPAHCPNNSPEWGRLRNTSFHLQGQSAVILGYGVIAARLIEMLAPFRMAITAYRRQPRGDEGVPTVALEGLPAPLASADHVISILPENAESRKFISAERLAKMKPGAIFYNIGRGTTVDQEALAASLQSGHLGAAWLDVTDPEPLPEDHILRRTPRCYITPHTAGGHGNESHTIVSIFLQNLRLFLDGSPLIDRIM
jgi:phosphoglycerate dehydrogenase-like enzyme